MTVTPDMVIAEAKKYLGWRYGYRDRCGGSYHELDCSGLICKVLNSLGLYVGCITSFVFAQLAFDHGLVIPKEKALEVPVLLIEGPNQGRGPSQRANGSDGHIVLCDRTYTVEERGHAYGCVEVPLDWNRINSFAIATWIPGVNYLPQVPPPPPVPKEYEDMIILAPARQQHNPNRPACARLDIESGQVGMLNGAKIHQIKTGTTVTVPIPAGSKVRGWYETFNANGSKKGFKVIASHDKTGWPAYEYTWV